MNRHDVIKLVLEEYDRAVRNYPPFASAHEGVAIIHEEFDELWGEVKRKQSEHSKPNMQKEAIQLAAMAIRFVTDVCNKASIGV